MVVVTGEADPRVRADDAVGGQADGRLELPDRGLRADVEGDDGMRKDGKRTMICRYSLLSMNSYFQALKSDVWGEMQIVERSGTLLAQALGVWSRD